MPEPGIYGWSPGTGGVHWYRMAEPLRAAGLAGIRTDSGVRLDDELAERFDTVLVHMIHDERSSEAWEKLATNGQHRMVFDIDDVMWDPDWEPFARHYTPERIARIWRNIQLAHVVTTPSVVIAETVARVNPNVYVCPNTVPEWLLSWSMPVRPGSAFGARHVIGYQGSPSHTTDFPPKLVRNLVRVIRRSRGWSLHFWGAAPEVTELIPGRVGMTPWADSVPDYYRSLSMDIGIGPLAATTFNAGKSALRVVEYAALGIPAVVSSGPPYDGWVSHGLSGFLVAPGESWFDPLIELVARPELREQMGTYARELAAAWTTEAGIGAWLAAWNSA